MSIQIQIPVTAPMAMPMPVQSARAVRRDAVLLREQDPLWQALTYWEPV